MSYSTENQDSYILSLASEIQGRPLGYMSQITCIRLTQREKKGGMTKQEASAHITELLALKGK